MHLRHGRPHRIRGWALFKSRSARLPQRRFMRLIHYTLTVFDAADEEADLVILEEVLVGAQVSGSQRRKEISVKLPGDKLTIHLRTDREYDAWFTAFRDAARVATDFYRIVIARELGRGAFSTVYFGFDREDGHHSAIKVVDKTKCSRAELTCAETEARMMAYLRHPSIVLCRDIFDAPDAMHVVMEYMSGATLEDRMLAMAVANAAQNNPSNAMGMGMGMGITNGSHVNRTNSNIHYNGLNRSSSSSTNSNSNSNLNTLTTNLHNMNLNTNGLITTSSSSSTSTSNGTPNHINTTELSNNASTTLANLAEGLKAPCFEESVAATVMGHVLSALAYLESEGVCHRDVKPDNILLSTLKNDKLWATSARLSDFGLAAFVDGDYELSDIVGTPHYVAPEVLIRDENDEFVGYGPPVDVWAAGIMMYWMLTGGKYPFDGNDSSEIFKKIRRGKLNLEIDNQNDDGDGNHHVEEELINISKEAKSLLYSLLNISPEVRLSAAGATIHPWLLKAQDIHLPAHYADRLKNKDFRHKCSEGSGGLTAKNRWRSIIFAVMLVQGLVDSVGEMGSHGGTNSSTTGASSSITTPASKRRNRLDKKRNQVSRAKKQEKKMAKAPERAPLGADGLGYNIGLFPSFTPKRRAKAGNTPTPTPTNGTNNGGSSMNGQRSSRNSGGGSNSIDNGTSSSSSTNTATTTNSRREHWFSGNGYGLSSALGAGFGFGSGAGSTGDDDKGSNGGNSLRISRDSRRSVSSGGSRRASRDRGGSVEKPPPQHHQQQQLAPYQQQQQSEKRGLSLDRRGGSVDRKSVGSSGANLSNITWAFLVRGRTSTQRTASRPTNASDG